MKNYSTATFGGGCFWCIEAIINQLEGVVSVKSGYAGGASLNPTYRQVCSGTTGHAEVIQVQFDESVLSYEDLISIFMSSHNPTTINKQGADRGTQYRSIILYHNQEQKLTAEKVFDKLSQLYDDPIVTQLIELDKFFPAENYHQDYYNRNSNAGYCRVVIDPKIAKLRLSYSDKLKKQSV